MIKYQTEPKIRREILKDSLIMTVVFVSIMMLSALMAWL